MYVWYIYVCCNDLRAAHSDVALKNLSLYVYI